MDTGQAIEDDRPSSRHNIEEALVGLGHMRKKRKVKSMKAKREASKERSVRRMAMRMTFRSRKLPKDWGTKYQQNKND